MFTLVQILYKSYPVSYKALNVVWRFCTSFTSIFFLYLNKPSLLFPKKRANFWVIYFFNLSVNGIKKHHNTLMQNGFLKAANNLTVMLCCKGHLIFKVVLYPLMCIRTYRKQLLRYIVMNKESENCNTWFWCLLFCYLPLPPPPISVAIFSTHGTVTK